MNAAPDQTMCQETDRPWMEAFVSVTGAPSSYKNAIEGVRQPVRQWVDAVIGDACVVLDKLPTRTAGDCATLKGGKDTLDLAANIGFSMPSEPILQRDFLKLEERRVRLAKLREEGDESSLAAYERECLNALTVLGFGYKSANPGDNTSIPELISSDKRGCGGIFISLSHWLKKLGLTAYACRVKEDFYGDEGHFTFIVRDAAGKFLLLDPSAHLRVTELTADLFDLEELARQSKRVDFCESRNFKLGVKNPASAYELPIHPKMVVGRVEDAKRELLLDWTMESMTEAAAQKSALDRVHALAGELFVFDGFPLELALKRMTFLQTDGLLDEALQETGEVFDKNPEGLITLYNVAINLLVLGDVVAGLEKLHQYLERNRVVIKNLLKAILHRSRTDCIIGGRVEPVINRFDEIRGKLHQRISIIELFVDHLGRLLQQSKTASFTDEDRLRFMALTLDKAKEMITAGTTFTTEWMQAVELEMRFSQERTLIVDENRWKSLMEEGKERSEGFLGSARRFSEIAESAISTV